MNITAISDIHGIPKRTPISHWCDVLVIAGDFSPLEIQRKKPFMNAWILEDFTDWMLHQPAEHVVVVPGNHDFCTIDPDFPEFFTGHLKELGVDGRIHYLCNSSATIDGVTFWGCPYSDIPGWAWYSGERIEPYMPPAGTDIMVVHQAPNFGGLGETYGRFHIKENYGSDYIMDALEHCTDLPKLLICGHIHEGNHMPELYERTGGRKCVMVNVSVKNEDYCEYFVPADIIYNDFPDNTDVHITIRHLNDDGFVYNSNSFAIER